MVVDKSRGHRQEIFVTDIYSTFGGGVGVMFKGNLNNRFSSCFLVNIQWINPQWEGIKWIFLILTNIIQM